MSLKLILATKKYDVYVDKFCKIIDGKPSTVRIEWYTRDKSTIAFYMDYEYISALDKISSIQDTPINPALLCRGYIDGKLICYVLHFYLGWVASNQTVSYPEFVNINAYIGAKRYINNVTDLTDITDNCIARNMYSYRGDYGVLGIYSPMYGEYFYYAMDAEDLDEVRQYIWTVTFKTNKLGMRLDYPKIINRHSCKLPRLADIKYTIFLTTFLYGCESNKTRIEPIKIGNITCVDLCRKSTIIRKLYESKFFDLPMGVNIAGNGKHWDVKYENIKCGINIHRSFSIRKYGFIEAYNMAIQIRQEYENRYGTTRNS